MNNLKDLRVRISSVKSTQKITSAMKMVATAKLRKAQERLDYSRSYVRQFRSSLMHGIKNAYDLDSPPLLLAGNPAAKTLILVLATDRGLCGGYNTSIIREVKALVREMHRKENDDHAIVVSVMGRKVKNTIVRECAEGRISARFIELDSLTCFDQSTVDFKSINAVAEEIIVLVESGTIGTVYVVTGQLNSIISQTIIARQLVPLALDQPEVSADHIDTTPYTIFEPKSEILLKLMLRHSFSAYLTALFLENTACEHAARMTAMDNSTRNARDMIQNLQLRYNQGRQAQITNELIEIISGSNAI